MAAKKGGGGKLSRSETVTVRLDSKLRYLTELAARKQRRTVSSFIEWAVEHVLKDIKIYEGTGYQGDDSVSVAEAANGLWDVDDAERFVRLARSYPELMTHEEQVRWKMLSDSGILGPARSRNRQGNVLWNEGALEDAVYPALRLEWQGLLDASKLSSAEQSEWVRNTQMRISAGAVYRNYTGEKAPSVTIKKSSSGFDDMDDDIPF